jgi:hypothetical protein
MRINQLRSQIRLFARSQILILHLVQTLTLILFQNLPM